MFILQRLFVPTEVLLPRTQFRLSSLLERVFAQCSATVKCLTISMFMDFPFPLILSFLSLSERLVLSLKVINGVLHSVTRRMQSCMSEGERPNKVSLK